MTISVYAEGSRRVIPCTWRVIPGTQTHFGSYAFVNIWHIMKNTALEQFKQQNWKPHWQSSKNNRFKYLSDKFDLPKKERLINLEVHDYY